MIIGTKKPMAACMLLSRKMPVIVLSMNGLKNIFLRAHYRMNFIRNAIVSRFKCNVDIACRKFCVIISFGKTEVLRL